MCKAILSEKRESSAIERIASPSKFVKIMMDLLVDRLVNFTCADGRVPPRVPSITVTLVFKANPVAIHKTKLIISVTFKYVTRVINFFDLIRAKKTLDIVRSIYPSVFFSLTN